MSALAFWKAVVEDHSNFLERVIGMLETNGIRYCVIGGVGVNAYSEPIVTQDLDIVIAAEDLGRARELLELSFRVKEFEHSTNIYDPGSKLQVQLRRREEFSPYPGRALMRDVMDLRLPVAAPEDLLASKIDAAREPHRRPSKHLKDLADIARLVEAFPELREQLPADVAALIRRQL